MSEVTTFTTEHGTFCVGDVVDHHRGGRYTDGVIRKIPPHGYRAVVWWPKLNREEGNWLGNLRNPRRPHLVPTPAQDTITPEDIKLLESLGTEAEQDRSTMYPIRVTAWSVVRDAEGKTTDLTIHIDNKIYKAHSAAEARQQALFEMVRAHPTLTPEDIRINAISLLHESTTI